MKKMLLLAVMTVAAIFILAACGSKSADNNSITGAGVENTGTAASAKITIKAKRFEFDQPVYKIKKGEPTEITLVSEDGVHGVEIPDMNLKLDADKPKVLTFDNAGTYEFHCDIMCGSGHSQMVAKIEVE
ncbi:cupredoxin domain-containing protein [Paenibacillus sp. R14(2021)]|uniref:cupredoxin domain-containing protein n=1 Tax=Paenibacillus sp. R14(2021) TaxID=2859228 RepID=UPI001C6165DE|nr:cupredoxin domain-containing protein [Paenibacillus sp. R14(2021)]